MRSRALAEAADHPVAITDRTGREAFLDPPALTAMRLLSQILQEQRIHRALETDLQSGDFAFSQCHQRHMRELKVPVERCHASLVARAPVESFKIGWQCSGYNAP
ncbi:hypothetical protein [Pelagerythrobacter aerophilus]